MKNNILFFILIILCSLSKAQVAVDLSGLNSKNGVKAQINKNLLTVDWPTGNNGQGKIIFDFLNERPLFKSFQLSSFGTMKEIGISLDPVFLLTIGKRDLISQNGWNIFFDKPNKLPHETYKVTLNKKSASVVTDGSRTIITIGNLNAASFSGELEVTLYNGSPLFNIAAVMSTEIDSTAILYDAGLVSTSTAWKNIAWSDTEDHPQSSSVSQQDTARNIAVKYRTIIGESQQGSLAIFPASHQYFYPLDEAFNLDFTWYGNNYRGMVPGFALGIRQDPDGDHRWVPWFNAPPSTKQRLNFFCLLSDGKPTVALEAVKRFTHGDVYKPLRGYKTMSSHFHNEYVMNVVLAGKVLPGIPNFVNVFKKTGIDIVHLAEFHYTAHPKGPDDQRLIELKALFDVCKQFSDDTFLLLPGEEPNEFFGGHWLDFFPNPVYWIMSRKEGMPFVTNDSIYGKVYRIGSKEDMMHLLEAENGLAWTAHARTKGSTGYPDKYKDEAFYKSDRFFGAAWKSIPADLSQPRLSKRVLDLMDDMANWGYKKHVIAEADLFSVEPKNEMYAHLNVNYLQMDKLPDYSKGWQPVLDVMQQGKFFVSTGEVLLPMFKVNGKGSGETIPAIQNTKATIELEADWTFPLNFAEIISGDGKKVYREKINLNHTTAFGKNNFTFNVDLKNRKWVRLELWDIAANGAFTQQVWIE
ncbi:hypothetical protein BH11BAC3_BH11BAC3_00810 [soil metagenome]